MIYGNTAVSLSRLHQKFTYVILGLSLTVCISTDWSLASDSSEISRRLRAVGPSAMRPIDSSSRDQELLTELWQAYVKKSPDLLLVIERLKKSGCSADTIAGFLTNPFTAAGAEWPSSVYVQPGMSLIDPNFEPTYPVLHEDGPAYLKFGRSKTLTYNGANIFAPARPISQAQRAAAMSSQAELISFYQMVRLEGDFFVSYLQNCREIQALQSLLAVKDRPNNKRGKLTVDQFERLRALESEHQLSHAKLVSRVGEEAALQFDNEIKIGSPSPSSASSQNERI